MRGKVNKELPNYDGDPLESSKTIPWHHFLATPRETHITTRRKSFVLENTRNMRSKVTMAFFDMSLHYRGTDLFFWMADEEKRKLRLKKGESSCVESLSFIFHLLKVSPLAWTAYAWPSSRSPLPSPCGGPATVSPSTSSSGESPRYCHQS